MRLLISAVLAVVIVGCSSESTGTPISVDITDTSFDLDVTSTAAGAVSFRIENTGGQVHEFEVIAGAEPGQVLPLQNGVADTTGLSVVDEVEDIVPGASTELNVELEPGTYLLICNLPAHYAAGNRAEFTVTG